MPRAMLPPDCSWSGLSNMFEVRMFTWPDSGASAKKPFCDGSHARVGFDGGPEGDGSAQGDEPSTP